MSSHHENETTPGVRDAPIVDVSCDVRGTHLALVVYSLEVRIAADVLIVAKVPWYRTLPS